MEKILNNLKEKVLDYYKQVIEFRKDYQPNQQMFHFYTGAKSYIVNVLEEIVNAQIEYEQLRKESK